MQVIRTENFNLDTVASLAVIGYGSTSTIRKALSPTNVSGPYFNNNLANRGNGRVSRAYAGDVRVNRLAGPGDWYSVKTVNQGRNETLYVRGDAQVTVSYDNRQCGAFTMADYYIFLDQTQGLADFLRS